jgi:hypothetical protein
MVIAAVWTRSTLDETIRADSTMKSLTMPARPGPR